MSQAPAWAQRALNKQQGRKPPARKWTPRCSHCFIWVMADQDGVVLIKCAHCTEVRNKIHLALVDQEWIRAKCGETRAAHVRLCYRGAR